jgi:tetratricopeptide (TPR) repeat protein
MKQLKNTLVGHLLLLGLLNGCSMSFDESGQSAQPKKDKARLADIYFSPTPLVHDPLPDKGLLALRDAYTTLMGLVSDPETRQIVQYRLADLELLLAEQDQESGEPIPASNARLADAKLRLGSDSEVGNGYYQLAIAQYQALLSAHPEQMQNVEVLYQLAKAYEQQGQAQQSFLTLEQLLKQYPQNPYLAEIHFRRGEILFNQTNYENAIIAYSKVLGFGEDNPYFATSAYMLGWTYFKTEQQSSALLAFTQLLDHNLPNQIIRQSALRQIDSRERIDRLSPGDKRLVNDTLRIMGLLFSYQDDSFYENGDSIQIHFQRAGARHYEYLLYDQLGQHYLNKDRFRDSAEVYQSFTKHHPLHDQAPLFAVKQIDAYILGSFPSLVLPAKQGFVGNYGINGQFWQDWTLVLKEQVSPFLEQYLQELAQYEHSRAQGLLKASRVAGLTPNAKALNSVISEEKEAEKPETSQARADSSKALAMQAFTFAARWYREFIETFPRHQETPALTFNLAESLNEAGNYEAAIESYEIYAYQYLAQPKAAEAGYAAILAYRRLREELSKDTSTFNGQDQGQKKEATREQASLWQDKQLLSQENFISRFAKDSRAVEVLHDSTQQLFTLKRYQLALSHAQDLLKWQPQPGAERLLANHLVIAHSHFALGQYERAEQEYQSILSLLSPSDKRQEDMQERLAASIYQQGEQNAAKNYLVLAVTDFLRVIAKTPNTAIRLNAQYDAATYLLEMKDWQQASNLLQDFRRRFPFHSLSSGVADKLIYAYQQNENWLPAANELYALWQAQPKSEQGRQALYVAAQYYRTVGERQLALYATRTYAHSYPEPFDEAIEARFNMSEFYQHSAEDSKRRFWLKKLILADGAAGSKRTNRSRYLAAMSSMVFADDRFDAFKNLKLTLPLKRSLQRKKQALELTLDAYQQTLDYKIAEFNTAANYKIAEIYHQLASDLIASAKPKNLNELELEQYQILLEEQSYPFEEKSIEIHEANVRRSWQGTYDDWVKQSFVALSELLPGRYNKPERKQEVVDEIH